MNKPNKLLRFAIYVFDRMLPGVVMVAILSVLVVVLAWVLDDPSNRIPLVFVITLAIVIFVILIELWCEFNEEEDLK